MMKKSITQMEEVAVVVIAIIVLAVVLMFIFKSKISQWVQNIPSPSYNDTEIEYIQSHEQAVKAGCREIIAKLKYTSTGIGRSDHYKIDKCSSLGQCSGTNLVLNKNDKDIEVYYYWGSNVVIGTISGSSKRGDSITIDPEILARTGKYLKVQNEIEPAADNTFFRNFDGALRYGNIICRTERVT